MTSFLRNKTVYQDDNASLLRLLRGIFGLMWMLI